ncbi:MAG: hypothetical protein E7411_03475 [Ruminococcaceae bacterium]|nr:hypothetical protein [Oscillospiraceae bacterium]
MAKSKNERYTQEALEALSQIINGAEDLKLIISAAKEILSVTSGKAKKDEGTQPLVIIKGDVED